MVEDNHQLLNIVNIHLQRNGFSLLLAQSGDEAMQLINTPVAPSLLLTDAVMPGSIQGPELALLYKSRWPKLPVVLMSGFVREADLEKLPTNTISSFLPKPFTLARLTEEISKTLLEADRDKLKKVA